LEKAAKEGDAIHKAIEASFLGEPYETRHKENVEAVHREIEDLFPHVDDWLAERTFAHHIGFGGTVDLHSPSTGIVVDYKTKDGDLSKRLHYDQYIQLAAYGKGLHLPHNVYAANIFVSRDNPGLVKSHVWEPKDLHKGWAQFSLCLELWKLEKNYDPQIRKEALK
jgi:hypothetical protein